jgi:FUS-interacting serine-arginine-rich protein 1
VRTRRPLPRISTASSRRSDVDLRKIFEKFGDIRDVYIPKDYYTKCVAAGAAAEERSCTCATGRANQPAFLARCRRPRGFAFIEFVDERDAGDAKAELDRMVLDGR